MTGTLSPATPDAVLDAVRAALADGHKLAIAGQGTKRGLGRPTATNRILDLSGLAGILLYEPDELVLSARAGTPMAAIEAALAEQRQMLAFEPMDMSGIYGHGRGAGTIGGALACNLAGPRRIKAGAARDHLLGFHAVSGRGEAFKSGGRVVKNVTGYDLSKLICGSHGTLAVLTEVTVKVLPAPEKSRTVVIYGLDETAATEAMAAALNSPHEVSGAAHLPQPAAQHSRVGYVRAAARSVTALRVEGPGPSVEHRCAALRAELARFGPVEELHSMNTRTLWREIRDVAPLLPDAARDLWRLSVPPASAPAVLADLFFGAGLDRGAYLMDWGGGLIWLTLPPRLGDHVAIRAAVAASGGHATLIRASVETRAAVPVFHPEPPALAALSQRVRAAFDPHGILSAEGGS
jgi:glycolate oxidase FAD binding subunit